MTPAAHPDCASTATTKRILTALSTLAIMAVIYGSWLPFEFDTAALRADSVAVLARMTWADTSLEDVLTNILVYVPAGLFLSLRLLLSGWNGWVRLAVVGILVALTILIAEGGQTIIHARHASFTDMLCNGLGTMVGLALAPAIWQRLTHLVDDLKLALARRPARALFWIVGLLVVFAKLAPFDLTIRPSDLSRSLADARWSPFDPSAAPVARQLEHLTETAGSFFAFALLGIFGSLSCREAGQSRASSAVNTLARLIFLAAAVELMQLVIVSHACDAADALTYVYGAALGAVLGATLLHERWRGASSGSKNPAGRLLLMAALTVQVVMIIGYAWPRDGEWVAPSEDSIHWIPFHAQFQASFARSVGGVVSSLMWYSTLAVMAAMVVARRSWHYRFVMASFITIGVVTLMEAVQAFSATRHADVTEPLLALLASIAATLACRWVEQLRPALATM